MKIFGVKIPEAAEECWPVMEYLPLVSKERQERVHRFVHKKDAVRSLIAELIVRIVIWEELRIPNANISFHKEEYGKPYLVGYPQFHYNLSHSGSWIVCAVDGATVGIDIERAAPIDLQIAQQYFTAEENAYIYASGTEEQQHERFYDVWSLKESYLKAVGKGLSIPLRSFSACPGASSGEFLLKTSASDAGEKDWFLYQGFIDPDYKLAVCSEQPFKSVEQKVWNMQEFINELKYAYARISNESERTFYGKS